MGCRDKTSHAEGIVHLREFEHRTGTSPCRNSLSVQDSVDGLYAGMKPSLARVDNTAPSHAPPPGAVA